MTSDDLQNDFERKFCTFDSNSHQVDITSLFTEVAETIPEDPGSVSPLLDTPGVESLLVESRHKYHLLHYRLMLRLFHHLLRTLLRLLQLFSLPMHLTLLLIIKTAHRCMSLVPHLLTSWSVRPSFFLKTGRIFDLSMRWRIRFELLKVDPRPLVTTLLLACLRS